MKTNPTEKKQNQSKLSAFLTGDFCLYLHSIYDNANTKKINTTQHMQAQSVEVE